MVVLKSNHELAGRLFRPRNKQKTNNFHSAGKTSSIKFRPDTLSSNFEPCTKRRRGRVVFKPRFSTCPATLTDDELRIFTISNRTFCESLSDKIENWQTNELFFPIDVASHNVHGRVAFRRGWYFFRVFVISAAASIPDKMDCAFNRGDQTRDGDIVNAEHINCGRGAINIQLRRVLYIYIYTYITYLFRRPRWPPKPGWVRCRFPPRRRPRPADIRPRRRWRRWRRGFSCCCPFAVKRLYDDGKSTRKITTTVSVRRVRSSLSSKEKKNTCLTTVVNVGRVYRRRVYGPAAARRARHVNARYLALRVTRTCYLALREPGAARAEKTDGAHRTTVARWLPADRNTTTAETSRAREPAAAAASCARGDLVRVVVSISFGGGGGACTYPPRTRSRGTRLSFRLPTRSVFRPELGFNFTTRSLFSRVPMYLYVKMHEREPRLVRCFVYIYIYIYL